MGKFSVEHPIRTRLNWGLALIILGLVILLILPQFFSPFLLSLAILILFWAYLGQCWNIMTGYTGQFSFGHAAYFGIGAYTSTWLLVNMGVNPWIGMIIGGIFAMLFGLFVGFLAFRSGLRGIYFALTTFAFSMVLLFTSSNLAIINKTMGIQVPLIGGDSWLRFQFETTRVPYYYIILGMMLVSIIVVYLIGRSKLGYYFKAIREDQDAAAALGVNLLRYKMTGMGISSFMTALGGTFYAQYFYYIDPDLVFGFFLNVEILLAPIIGGVGTLFGPVVGALILTPLSEFTRTLIRQPPGFLPFLLPLQGRAGVDVMLYGLILIVIIIFLPQGLVGWIRQLRRRGHRYLEV